MSTQHKTKWQAAPWTSCQQMVGLKDRLAVLSVGDMVWRVDNCQIMSSVDISADMSAVRSQCAFKESEVRTDSKFRPLWPGDSGGVAPFGTLVTSRQPRRSDGPSTRRASHCVVGAQYRPSEDLGVQDRAGGAVRGQ
jgi:hypothetical protein